MKCRSVGVWLVFLCCCAGADGQGSIFPWDDNADLGREVLNTRIFEGSGLWGYIDGGADIYMEYGFDRVYVQDILLEGHPFLFETFCMQDSRAAFGIFSVYRYHCIWDDSLAFPHCISPYQVLAVMEKYYLVISNQAGTALHTQLALKQLQSLQQVNQTDPMLFPEPFAGQDALNRLKYMEGPLGITNGYPVFSTLFEPFQSFELMLLPLDGKENKSVLARVDFLDPVSRNTLKSSLSSLQKKGEMKIFLQKNIDPFSMLFLIGPKKEKKIIKPYLRPLERN
ncbi:MAG: hypothetical protein KBB71_00460 [Lentimicrobiaceae bacterium]|nr:hypothetical protein [Lentimicrobiaceae bacterium]